MLEVIILIGFVLLMFSLWGGGDQRSGADGGASGGDYDDCEYEDRREDERWHADD